jgi:[citrate (pro-3S)-lyase] ligase
MTYQLRDIILDQEITQVKALLKQNGLTYEDHITYTIGLFDGDLLIATGSLDDNVIKMLAVDEKYQGEQLLSNVLTRLISLLHTQKKYKYFVFTKPKNKKFFMDYNLFLIYEDENILFFENKVNTIVETLHEIKYNLKLKRGSTASLVMNCNPMTLGHLYLIETAAKTHDNVIIFLVEENRSVFTFETRFKIVKKSVKYLKNVVVLPSTSYIISKATFPTYFSKNLNEASELYTKLDIHIFKEYFMSILNIDFRYVGTEPLDPLTNLYNEQMKKILQNQLVIVDRLEKDSQTISASYIRKLAREHQFELIKELVPKATYQFLKSKKGQKVFHE